MKILYAVQATGNGHITRARLMAKAFKQLDISVDWVFTGRKRSELFDMQEFGDFKTKRGMSFVIKNGKIDNLRTVFSNNILTFFRDVFQFKFDGYDLVINDFEPVTAWAAKLRKIKSIGISHQMAFQKDIPISGRDFIAETVLKNFAPVKMPIGVHWDDFGQSLLPPVIDEQSGLAGSAKNKILVYFPFCEEKALIDWFEPFKDYEFHIFHGSNFDSNHSHIHFYPFSRDHFQQKQRECSGIITGAGFELPSEAIQMGHKLLVLPLEGQMEQQSNATALENLGRATVLHTFNQEQLNQWLDQPQPTPSPYPNVALELAKWLVSHKNESLESLSKRLWSLVREPDSKSQPEVSNILECAVS